MFSLTHRRHRPRQETRSVSDPIATLGGHAKTSLAHYSEMLGHCSEMIQLDPEDPEAYRDRGILYLREGNYTGRSRSISVRRQRCFDKAITDFTTAIRFAPRDASLYLSRGIAFSAEGQLDRAIADFTEAIRRLPVTAAQRLHYVTDKQTRRWQAAAGLFCPVAEVARLLAPNSCESGYGHF